MRFKREYTDYKERILTGSRILKEVCLNGGRLSDVVTDSLTRGNYEGISNSVEEWIQTQNTNM